MSGLFGVLDVANSGMAVQSRSIRTTGHNIANVDNPDYTRQRSISQAIRPTVTANGAVGNGVEQKTIDRVTDRFIENRLLKHRTQLGSTETQSRALSEIESVFNEQNGPGLGAGLDDFYRSFADLAAASTPGAPAERTAVQAASRRLVSTIHSLDEQLRNHYESTNLAIETAMPRINEISREINDLNRRIVETEITTPANDLRDTRDGLIRELSTLLEVNVAERDGGAISVTLSSGLPLVEGTIVHELVAEPGGTPTLGLTEIHVFWQGSGGRVDVSSEIGGGELGGLLRIRETTLPAAIRSLDTVAYNLAATVNGVHNAGVGLNGAVGNFFVLPAQVENAARDLEIDPAILANVDSIAAGLTTAAGDNRNAVALAGLRDTSAAVFLPGDPPGPPSGPGRTLLEHVSTITIDIGEQARGQAADAAAQGRIVEDLENRRDEVSGVSLDEEMAGLIQMEAAFQANARMVRVVDSLLEDVLRMI